MPLDDTYIMKTTYSNTMAYASPPGGVSFGSTTKGWKPSPWVPTERPSGRRVFGGTGFAYDPYVMPPMQMQNSAAFVRAERAAKYKAELKAVEALADTKFDRDAKVGAQIHNQFQKQYDGLGVFSGVKIVETMNSRSEEIMYMRDEEESDTAYLSSEIYEGAQGVQTDTYSGSSATSSPRVAA